MILPPNFSSSRISFLLRLLFFLVFHFPSFLPPFLSLLIAHKNKKITLPVTEQKEKGIVSIGVWGSKRCSQKEKRQRKKYDIKTRCQTIKKHFLRRCFRLMRCQPFVFLFIIMSFSPLRQRTTEWTITRKKESLTRTVATRRRKRSLCRLLQSEKSNGR